MSKNKAPAPQAPAEPEIKAANIIPAVVAPEVLEDVPLRSDEDLLAEAKRIAESEVPRIDDSAVHNLGQDGKNYGKVQSVQEVVYEAHDRKLNKTVSRVAIRIDH